MTPLTHSVTHSHKMYPASTTLSVKKLLHTQPASCVVQSHSSLFVLCVSSLKCLAKKTTLTHILQKQLFSASKSFYGCSGSLYWDQGGMAGWASTQWVIRRNAYGFIRLKADLSHENRCRGRRHL